MNVLSRIVFERDSDRQLFLSGDRGQLSGDVFDQPFVHPRGKTHQSGIAHHVEHRGLRGPLR